MVQSCCNSSRSEPRIDCSGANNLLEQFRIFFGEAQKPPCSCLLYISRDQYSKCHRSVTSMLQAMQFLVLLRAAPTILHGQFLTGRNLITVSLQNLTRWPKTSHSSKWSPRHLRLPTVKHFTHVQLRRWVSEQSRVWNVICQAEVMIWPPIHVVTNLLCSDIWRQTHKLCSAPHLSWCHDGLSLSELAMFANLKAHDHGKVSVHCFACQAMTIF